MNAPFPPAVGTFEVHPNPNPMPAEARAKLMEKLSFGKVFSDHMAIIPYREGSGWGAGEIKAYAP